jgi:hypothetical protein
MTLPLGQPAAVLVTGLLHLGPPGRASRRAT